ncbi:MAG: hypothetical protein M2R45_04775 [Verrucomicrobia subdivision 3 bacterium]|nr:hypothetical protein [Limisphaerales bacterium]MCS1417420.1 hypothetical protein [Limisphaerales bacterium]
MLKSILINLAFLFRVEKEPDDAQPGEPYRITDFELASRLSFFIWSSIPDDELLILALKGCLCDRAFSNLKCAVCWRIHAPPTW